jgi:hypothetical protein
MRHIIKPVLLLILALNVNAQNNNEIYQFSKDIALKIEKDTLLWKYQMGATHYSISGYYKKALETWDKNGAGISKLSKEDSLYFSSFKPQNAKKYIIHRSKEEKIIIINEAHHNSMHRVFTTSLLQNLFDHGYRFFGLEAISDTLINKRKFVTKESGYYTNESQMANLINEAIKIGFTIFNYETSSGKNNKEREIEQAQNIAKKMSENPHSKFLIHCGWEHVIEGTPRNKNWGKAMAGRLKEFTNIDPFTIDQTIYTEKGDAKFNVPHIQLVNLDFPVIMVNEDGKTFNGDSESDKTDCIIIHPVTNCINERPNWLSLSGQRKTCKIQKSKITEFPVLVLAYTTGEYEKNGIPCDVIEILEEKEIGNLILKKGKYKIIVKDKNYKVISEYEQEVN